MITAHDLPEPVDGPTPLRNTPEWQARRLNRLAGVVWEAVPLIGKDDRIAISTTPDSGTTQITLHVHAPADLIVAESMVFRLGWDTEAEIKRVGMTRHHYWHGMIGGFRAYAVWIEVPAAGDSQGRAEFEAGIGVGNREADAEHVARLTASARAGRDGGGMVVGPGSLSPTRPAPMEADLQRLGYEL